MAITPKPQHDQCEVCIYIDPTKVQVQDRWMTHYGYLHCKDHNKQIQWLNKQDADLLETLGVEVKHGPRVGKSPW